MYAPEAFRRDEPDALAALISAHPLSTLVVAGKDGPVAAYVPFALECDLRGAPTALIGHMARANPAWQEADGSPVLAVFSGPDAYVTPSLYLSKAEHGRVVPTWDYVRVEVRGRLFVETEPDRLADYIRAPTDAQEAGRLAPWSVDDAPADFVARLGNAIVGLRLPVEAIAGKWKLSQDRNEGDYSGVLTGFSASVRPNERAVAEVMAQIR